MEAYTNSVHTFSQTIQSKRLLTLKKQPGTKFMGSIGGKSPLSILKITNSLGKKGEQCTFAGQITGLGTTWSTTATRKEGHRQNFRKANLWFPLKICCSDNPESRYTIDTKFTFLFSLFCSCFFNDELAHKQRFEVFTLNFKRIYTFLSLRNNPKLKMKTF